MRAVRLALLAPLLSVMFAQDAHTQPDASDILKKVSDTYRSVAQYDVESTITIHDAGSGRDLSGSTRVAMRVPNAYRMEAKGSMLDLTASVAGANPGEVITVYDGSKLWGFYSKSSEYRVYENPPSASLPLNVDISAGIGTYRRALEVFGPGRFLREEKLKTGDTEADCYVIEAGGQASGALLWIDKSNYHVLRMDTEAQGSRASQVFTTVKLDVKLPDELFQFTPAPDARRVSSQ